jgi:hypothetical protein
MPIDRNWNKELRAATEEADRQTTKTGAGQETARLLDSLLLFLSMVVMMIIVLNYLHTHLNSYSDF